jgi:hypothetical protein
MMPMGCPDPLAHPLPDAQVNDDKLAITDMEMRAIFDPVINLILQVGLLLVAPAKCNACL